MPKPSPDITDEQLMLAIKNGGRNAFEKLYERYFDKLVWFANGFVKDTEKAEDIVQEVFIRIIEKPGKFDERKKFSTWVYTVTANACKNSFRDDQTRSRLLEENKVSIYEQTAATYDPEDHKLLKAKIKKVYDGLNEKEKSIYLLRFEQEFSIKEIGEITGIPEGSVKSGIYYMLKKFAVQLKEFAHGK